VKTLVKYLLLVLDVCSIPLVYVGFIIGYLWTALADGANAGVDAAMSEDEVPK